MTRYLNTLACVVATAVSVVVACYNAVLSLLGLR